MGLCSLSRSYRNDSLLRHNGRQGFLILLKAEAADIMRQLVSAVGFLHAKRIVHRDLKPENILFESEDSSARLRLVDFGFARLLPACVEQQLKSVYRKMYAQAQPTHHDTRP
ncbi:hypothetical protein COOONC_14350 [Cooperia oncophora]